MKRLREQSISLQRSKKLFLTSMVATILTTMCLTLPGNVIAADNATTLNIKHTTDTIATKGTAPHSTASLSTAYASTTSPINPNQLYRHRITPEERAPYANYFWRYDSKDNGEYPDRFRMITNDARFNPKLSGIFTTGLDTLRISGSSQPTVQQFKHMAKEIKSKTDGPVFDVDLRQETHLFVNDYPISRYAKRDWINVGKVSEEILTTEEELVKTLPGQSLSIHRLTKEKTAGTGMTITVTSVATEASVARKAGFNYWRLTATDHIWPDATIVDQFISLYRNLPTNAWLHFHCEAGKGRTTTFMALYDMMRNPHVPLYDILKRQEALGGISLMATGNEKGWKAPYSKQRSDMLALFHQYVTETTYTNYATPWSTWLNRHNENK